MGNGLVTELDNEKWKNRRALFNPGFHRGYIYLLNSLKKLLKYLQQKAFNDFYE